ncbi:helix-turn-helix domain-containing protein [Pasteurella caecimuris]|uniref:helix-turn-helix transcriptional regulator n=1 Tax=Rodentibacter caecimuris TaxID=1796644 RepID=UPI00214F9B79|nr:helix-turn-helix domain-containing protein [Pasteurella caecimuris]MCR1837681.1 helix-turn-helix domain-containing protein [Pasteurella caecimuris]MCU0106635.1 helix-turn-helix domain-containing protein [Pasteurella caecimuris]
MEKTTDSQQRYYSTATLCEMLDVSRSWLWEQSKAGKFPKPVKFGRLARYPVEAVERYLAQQNHTTENPNAH